MSKEVVFYVRVQIVANELNEENVANKEIIIKPEWHSRTFCKLEEAQIMFNIATRGEQDILDNLS